MRPVAPRTSHPEVTYAENQLEYLPVTVARVEHDDGSFSLLTRWSLTPKERQRVAAGEDIYVAQPNWGQPMTPLTVRCGPGPYVWCSCGAAQRPDPLGRNCQECESPIPQAEA